MGHEARVGLSGAREAYSYSIQTMKRVTEQENSMAWSQTLCVQAGKKGTQGDRYGSLMPSKYVN
jgi:hypothetical protein